MWPTACLTLTFQQNFHMDRNRTKTDFFPSDNKTLETEAAFKWPM